MARKYGSSEQSLRRVGKGKQWQKDTRQRLADWLREAHESGDMDMFMDIMRHAVLGLRKYATVDENGEMLTDENGDIIWSYEQLDEKLQIEMVMKAVNRFIGSGEGKLVDQTVTFDMTQAFQEGIENHKKNLDQMNRLAVGEPEEPVTVEAVVREEA